jgi:hypothetical protein
MFGLVVLAFLTVYVAVALWITAKAPGWWRLPVTLAWIALPTWDAALGRAVLHSECARNTSLQLSAPARPVEALFVPTTVFPSSPAFYGYRIVEGTSSQDRYKAQKDSNVVQRATRDAKGVVALEDMVPRSASVGLFEQRLPPSLLVVPTRHFVKDLRSGQELGGFNTFYFPGGWVEKALAAGGVHGQWCFPSDEQHQRTLELLSRTVPAL